MYSNSDFNSFFYITNCYYEPLTVTSPSAATSASSPCRCTTAAPLASRSRTVCRASAKSTSMSSCSATPSPSNSESDRLTASLTSAARPLTCRRLPRPPTARPRRRPLPWRDLWSERSSSRPRAICPPLPRPVGLLVKRLTNIGTWMTLFLSRILKRPQSLAKSLRSIMTTCSFR